MWMSWLKLLGPLLAPFVSKAVNLASAAYIARTLARPAIPVSMFAEASLHLSGAAAKSWTADGARRGPTNPERGLGMRSSPLRRSATASWVLSEGYELLDSQCRTKSVVLCLQQQYVAARLCVLWLIILGISQWQKTAQGEGDLHLPHQQPDNDSAAESFWLA